MRIVVVSYLHPAVTPGGAQQVAYELFRAARGESHDAYLISALTNHHEERFGKPGAPIVPMPGEENQYFFFPQFYNLRNLAVEDWRSLSFFRELIGKLAPDVIHFHHYHRIGIDAIRAARVAAPDAVICLTFHEMMAICNANGQMVTRDAHQLCTAASPIKCNKRFPELRPEFFTLRAARLRAVLSDCDLFTFPSEFLARRYIDWGLPAEKGVVVQNGQVNLGENFDRAKRSKALNRFGYFGQLLDNKGLDIIFQALLRLVREERVPQGGIVLEINGGNRSSASKGYLEKLRDLDAEIRSIGSGQIAIVDNGQYDQSQLAERMDSIDWVIVASTWWEVFGLVLSEAWMFGRPPIVSAIAGLEERVQHGVNGFKFPVRDFRALAYLIASLCGNEGEWRQVNSSIAQPWTDRDMLHAYLALWRELRQPPINPGRPRRRDLPGPVGSNPRIAAEP